MIGAGDTACASFHGGVSGLDEMSAIRFRPHELIGENEGICARPVTDCHTAPGNYTTDNPSNRRNYVTATNFIGKTLISVPTSRR
jgi:hypothetical protein